MSELEFKLMCRSKEPTRHLAATVELDAGDSVKCQWSYEKSWHVCKLWVSGGPFLIKAPFITGAAAADFYCSQSDEGKGEYVGFDVKRNDVSVGASADLTIEIIAQNFGLLNGPRILQLVMETST